jgi:hypothetical protein
LEQLRVRRTDKCCGHDVECHVGELHFLHFFDV